MLSGRILGFIPFSDYGREIVSTSELFFSFSKNYTHIFEIGNLKSYNITRGKLKEFFSEEIFGDSVSLRS